jgi:catenin beta 1
LRHITCRHSHASEAQDAVRNVDGLLPIVDLLNPTLYSWPIVKSTISLIRNLALSINNLPVLRETGAIQKLAQLLVRSHQELQKQPANGQLIDNYIRMDDILEACVSALHIIARDQQNRIIIRDLDCIPLFVRVRRVSLSIMKKVYHGSRFVFNYRLL